MTESLQVALVGAGSAIVGAIVSGLFTYLAGKPARSLERLRGRLRLALEDVLSLRELEEHYCERLAALGEGTPEGVKRRAWEGLERKPSARSEPARVRRELDEEYGG